MFGLLRNRCSACRGISVRLGAESVFGFGRNTQVDAVRLALCEREELDEEVDAGHALGHGMPQKARRPDHRLPVCVHELAAIDDLAQPVVGLQEHRLGCVHHAVLHRSATFDERLDLLEGLVHAEHVDRAAEHADARQTRGTFGAFDCSHHDYIIGTWTRLTQGRLPSVLGEMCLRHGGVGRQNDLAARPGGYVLLTHAPLLQDWSPFQSGAVAPYDGTDSASSTGRDPLARQPPSRAPLRTARHCLRPRIVYYSVKTDAGRAAGPMPASCGRRSSGCTRSC